MMSTTNNVLSSMTTNRNAMVAAGIAHSDSSLSATGVMSLTVHPDHTKPQMLLMSHDPTQLRVFNMTTYRPISNCSGFKSSVDGTAVFCRATFSADGRYALSGVPVAPSKGGMHQGLATAAAVNARPTKQSTRPYYKLHVWDALSGIMQKTALSGMFEMFRQSFLE